MIINHSHRFIFVHVPKAAGTSVSAYFSRFSTYRDLEVGGTELGEALQQPFKRRFGLSKHSTSEEVRAVVGDDTWHEYFKFAFVRDPYSRAMSTYRFLKRWYENKHIESLSFIAAHADFRSFVMSTEFAEQKVHRLLWPQARWLCDAQGGKLVDFVGHIESIDADIAQILSLAPGLAQAETEPEPAPARNRTARADDKLQHLLATDPEVEHRIHEAYRIDFEAFGYPRQTASPAAPECHKAP